MMGQMGMNTVNQNVRYPGHMPTGNRMGVRPQNFQQIPPSGPMMRQQVGPGMGMPPGPDMQQQQQQRMRFPQAGPGMPGMMGGPQKPVSMSHPSPQPPQGGGGGPPMWNAGPGGHPMHHGNVPMGSGSPHPHSPMQPTAIASPRPPGTSYVSYKP